MELNLVAAAGRRHWPVMLALFLIGPVLAVAYVLSTAPQYRSTATVLFGLSGAQTVREVVDGGAYVQDAVPSYADLATTPAVLDGVIETLGLDVRPATLARRIDVERRSQSVLVDISAVGGSASSAADLANGVADQMTIVVPDLSAGDKASGSLPLTVTVVSPAQPAPKPFSPNVARALLLGLLAGLALAAVYLYLREAVASNVRTREDVAEITDAPVVATLVRDPRGGVRPLPTDTHPHLSRAESIRMFRTNLLPKFDDTTVVLAIVSPGHGDGRTSTLANLAITIAHTGRRVLVIDADLQRPRLASLLLMPDQVGLSNFLSGQIELNQIVQRWRPQRWNSHTIDVIAAGPAVEHSSELLSSPAMATLLDQAGKNYDVVLVDTPPLLEMTDGILLAAQADASLMVVDARQTESRALAEAFERLSMVGATVLGVALNNVPDTRARRARDTAYRERSHSAADVVDVASSQILPAPTTPSGGADIESVPRRRVSTRRGARQTAASSEYQASASPGTTRIEHRSSTAPRVDPPVVAERVSIRKSVAADAALITNELELDSIRRQVEQIRATTPGQRRKGPEPEGEF